MVKESKPGLKSMIWNRTKKTNIRPEQNEHTRIQKK